MRVGFVNMETVEKECGALGGLFQAIVNDMKYSYPVWEDFSAKATKLHSQLRSTVLAAVAFLDAFQKVADMATSARGATRDIGSALTRMCMRHRSIETKLRHFTNALMENLVTPLQDRIEDWKKTANQLDKDHAKEYKRSRHEIKKKSSDTLKLQKKARKGRGDLQPQLDSAMQDVTDMCLLMEETEKQAVRRALVEERGRFCTFISFLQPVVKGEIAMLGEITHLQAIIDDLTVLTADPHKLPLASEQPASAATRGAQRFSMVSSHDSGSQDANVFPKPALPMTSDITSQKSSSSASSEASETCQSISECNSPSTDWLKPGPNDQSLVSTPQRRKEASERLKEPEVPVCPQGYAGIHTEDSQRPRMIPTTVTAKYDEEVSPATSDLAKVLTHRLSMEQQRNSRDSLQSSSGYSTQPTTPSCSKDTIPSQASDYDCCSVNGDAEGEPQTDFDKSSTIPRQSNIVQSYRRMVDGKRPASTAGLPSGMGVQAGLPSGGGESGGGGGAWQQSAAPSTKTGVRRSLSSAGPIPIRPPVVPVKTPMVPGSPGRAGIEESILYADDSLANMVGCAKASPKRLSLPNSAWEPGMGLDMSMYAQQPAAPKITAEEDQLLAVNRHSLMEQIGELVAGAHAMGEGQIPLTSPPNDPNSTQCPSTTPTTGEEDMLLTIRRGVRLRRAVSNDRSAPRIL